MRLIAPFKAGGRGYVYEATDNKIYQVGEGIYELIKCGGDYQGKVSDTFNKSPVKGFRFYLIELNRFFPP